MHKLLVLTRSRSAPPLLTSPPRLCRYYSIRIHVALGAIMGFIGVFQLLPFLRWRFMKAHRVLGYTYAARECAGAACARRSHALGRLSIRR